MEKIHETTLTEHGRVLVVDDNPLIVGVLRTILEQHGYQVTALDNPPQALEILNNWTPDVIVSDVMMPSMDGYEFHESVRKYPEYAHIPFIFLSALSDKQEVARGHSSGADEYITKPFEPAQLLAVMRGKVVRSRMLQRLKGEEEEKYKKKIVQTLSHEFRTPLVAITTGSELLKDNRDTLSPQKTSQLIESIYRGGQRLERLVNDFMLLQQIEAGIAQRMYESRAQEMDLRSISQSMVEQQSMNSLWPGITLVLEPHVNPLPCKGYFPQLHDVLRRLIDNAVKFSPAACTVALAEGSDEAHVWLEIQDAGRGMTEQEMENASKAFEQMKRDQFEQQGSGLGLAIVGKYLGLHNAKLQFRANIPSGTIVRVALKKLTNL